MSIRYVKIGILLPVLDRIVPAQDPDAWLNVKLERFYEWVIDGTSFKDHESPAIKGVKSLDDLVPYIERKLYTVNTGHTAAAYWGYNMKKTIVYDLLQDSKIHEEVRRALAETGDLIVGKHGIGEEEQKEYVEKIITRISNPILKTQWNVLVVHRCET
jgi:mannitol-1-phosphate 5-dehydrogenase